MDTLLKMLKLIEDWIVPERSKNIESVRLALEIMSKARAREADQKTTEIIQKNGGEMVFKEGNKLGFTSEEPLEKNPICFLGRVGQKEALKNIPEWQELIRDFVDELIDQSKPS